MNENSKTTRAWLARFSAVLRDPGAYFPLFDANNWTLNQPGTAGIGYWLKPRETTTPWLQVWFPETLTARHHPGVDWRKSEIYTVVYWPRFLAAAQSTQFSPLRPLATRLWFLLRPHVALFDQMFADDLGAWAAQYEANPTLAAERPLYFGETSVADVKRFDAHLAQLLRSDRFNRHVAQVMNEFMAPAASPHAAYTLKCADPVCSRSQVRFCEHCRAGKALRWHGSVLRMKTLRDFARGWHLPPAEPSIAENASALLKEAAYLMSGLVSEDGAVIETTQPKLMLVVCFETVLRRLQGTRRESILAEFADGVDDHLLWTQAVNARRFFDSKLADCLADPRPPAFEMAQKHGLPWANDFEHSIGIYDLSKMRNRLARDGAIDNRRRNVLLARARSKRQTIKPERRFGLVDYRGPTGNTYTLKVLGHKKRYYFQPPEPVTSGDYPRDYARKFKGQFYFTPSGASRFLRRDAFGAAEHWSSWLMATYMGFGSADFRRLRYDNQYSERLTAINTGEQQRLGRFSTQEFQVLDGFLRVRPPKTGLSEAEWAEISQALPTRSKASIRNAIEKLGKDYAIRNGWVAYVNSPYCIQISSARRRRWAEDGVET